MILYLSLGIYIAAILSHGDLERLFWERLDPNAALYVLVLATILWIALALLLFFTVRRRAWDQRASRKLVGAFVALFFVFGLLFLQLRQMAGSGEQELGALFDESPAYYSSPVTAVTGTINSMIERQKGRSRFDLKVTGIIRRNQQIPAQGLLRVYAFDLKGVGQVVAQSKLERVQPGDKLLLMGSPSPLAKRFPKQKFSSYRSYLRDNGYDGFFYVNKLSQIALLSPKEQSLGLRARFLRWAQSLRQKLWQRSQKVFSPTTAALMKGLVMGDDSALPASLQRAFRRSGTAHLLAASGLHLTLLFSFLFIVLGRLPYGRRLAPPLVLVAGLGYWFIAGFKISLLRAYLLAAVPIVSSAGERRVNVRQALALVLFSILLIMPQQLYQPGFLLSAGAVLAILWLSPPLMSAWNNWADSLPLPKKGEGSFGSAGLALALRRVVEGLVVSFSASLGVAPVLWIYFEQFQPLSLLFNVLVIPLGSLALLLSFLALLFLYIWPAFVSFVLFGWLEFIARALLAVVVQFGRVPVLRADSALAFSLGIALVVFFAIPLALVSWGRQRKRRWREQFFSAKGYRYHPSHKWLFVLPLLAILSGQMLFAGRAFWLDQDRTNGKKERIVHYGKSLYLPYSQNRESPSKALPFLTGNGFFIGQGKELARSSHRPHVWLAVDASPWSLRGYDRIRRRQPCLVILVREKNIHSSFFYRRFLARQTRFFREQGASEGQKPEEISSCPGPLTFLVSQSQRGAVFVPLSQTMGNDGVWSLGRMKRLGLWPQGVRLLSHGLVYEGKSFRRLWLDYPKLKDSDNVAQVLDGESLKGLKHPVIFHQIKLWSLMQKNNKEAKFTRPWLYTGREYPWLMQRWYGHSDLCFVKPLLPFETGELMSFCRKNSSLRKNNN